MRGNSLQHLRPLALAAPAVLWLGLFLLVPLLFVLGMSLFSTGDYGEIEPPLTAEHFRRLIGFGTFGWDPLYLVILGRSVLLAATSTLLCVLLGLPVAFAIASLPGRWKAAALIFVIVPLWINLLIRTYAWQMLLGPGSWLSDGLLQLGLRADALYPGSFAVHVGMVCDYLPFLILPLYASVEKIDWSLAEAARDLGASRWNVWRHGILPQITPGLAAGIILVLVPATGQFVIPDLLGGAKTVLLGNVIHQQFGPSRNWPFGSALTSVAIALMLIALLIQSRIRARRGTESTT